MDNFVSPYSASDSSFAFDFPITFVTSNEQRDVHVFIPDTFDLDFAKEIATNFSRKIQQPVKAFLDISNHKIRLCPMPDMVNINTAPYGRWLFTSDASEAKPPQINARTAMQYSILEGSSSEKRESRIPRPPNSWILFRQFKSKELSKTYPGTTAAELSTIIAKLWREAPCEIRQYWNERAKEEDRLHKAMYPGYKFTARKKDEAAN